MNETPLPHDSDVLAARFLRDGFIVLSNVVAPDTRAQLLDKVAADLEPLTGPVEYEADVGYPGAPANRQAQGGETPRRLLHAYARAEIFRKLARQEETVALLEHLIGEEISLTQCHHNCVMTKYPGYSSATAWHQDVRYWTFDSPDLITAWVALADEDRSRGALRVIPGSHRLDLDRGRFDKNLFLRTELQSNKALIRSAVDIELRAGDVLLFSARLFHAAGKNLTSEPKFSVVFSYHGVSNCPIPGTRSASLPGIAVRNDTDA